MIPHPTFGRGALELSAQSAATGLQDQLRWHEIDAFGYAQRFQSAADLRKYGAGPQKDPNTGVTVPVVPYSKFGYIEYSNSIGYRQFYNGLQGKPHTAPLSKWTEPTQRVHLFS